MDDHLPYPDQSDYGTNDRYFVNTTRQGLVKIPDLSGVALFVPYAQFRLNRRLALAASNFCTKNGTANANLLVKQ